MDSDNCHLLISKICRFETVHVLSEASESWDGLRGRVNESLIKTHLPAPPTDNSTSTGSPQKRTFVCVCGPTGFTTAMSKWVIFCMTHSLTRYVDMFLWGSLHVQLSSSDLHKIKNLIVNNYKKDRFNCQVYTELKTYHSSLFPPQLPHGHGLSHRPNPLLSMSKHLRSINSFYTQTN